MKMRHLIRAILAAAAAATLAACANIGQQVKETVTVTETTTNGIVRTTVNERVTRAGAQVLGNAANTVDKLKVTNGKTQSIGYTGFEQSASDTNVLAGLSALGKIAGALK
jgi:hypothetical protein